MKFVVPLFTICVGVEALWKTQWFQQPIDHRSSACSCAFPTHLGDHQGGFIGSCFFWLGNWGQKVGSFQQCLDWIWSWSCHGFIAFIGINSFIWNGGTKTIPGGGWSEGTSFLMGKFLVCLEVKALHFNLRKHTLDLLHLDTGASRGVPHTLLLRQWRRHRGTFRKGGVVGIDPHETKRNGIEPRSLPISVASYGRRRSLGCHWDVVGYWCYPCHWDVVGFEAFQGRLARTSGFRRTPILRAKSPVRSSFLAIFERHLWGEKWRAEWFWQHHFHEMTQRTSVFCFHNMTSSYFAWSSGAGFRNFKLHLLLPCCDVVSSSSFSSLPALRILMHTRLSTWQWNKPSKTMLSLFSHSPAHGKAIYVSPKKWSQILECHSKI